MEKERFNPENQIPQNLRRFYSSDPYEVLGVPSTATSEEIKQVWRKVQRKFHPDVSKDPRAAEISQNINVAYDTLTNKRGGTRGGSRTETHRQSSPPEYGAGFGSTHRETRRERTEGVEEKKIFEALRRPSDFKRYVLNAKAGGISEEKIAELIKTEKAQGILKKEFISFVEIYGKDGAEKCIAYAEEWKQLGVDVSNFVNLPEVRKILEMYAVEYKVEIFGKENANAFLNFVASWKKFGVDLSQLIHTKKAKKILEHQAIEYKIEIYGTENPNKFLEFVDSWKQAGVDLSQLVQSEKAKRFLADQAVGYKIEIYGNENPDKFLAFVREWKRAGIDLSDLVNSKKAQAFLEDQSKFKLKHNPKNFKAYVQSWIQAGWKPSPEIMSALEKA
jgi:arsenate reductase-like glutaredoxin family protein